MFYSMLFLQILVAIEGYILIKKRNKKKGLLLEVINGLLLFINLFVLPKPLSSHLSSIVYFQSNSSIMLTIYFLILLGFMMVIYQFYKATNTRKIQPKLLKYLFPVLIGINTFFTLNILFPRLIYYVIFLGLSYLICLIIQKLLKKFNKFYFIGLVCFFSIFIYSFCTYTGAARLKITLMGYPITAYKTGLEELKYYREKNIRKYISIAEVSKKDGKLGIIEVKNFVIFKTASEQPIE